MFEPILGEILIIKKQKIKILCDDIFRFYLSGLSNRIMRKIFIVTGDWSQSN